MVGNSFRTRLIMVGVLTGSLILSACGSLFLSPSQKPNSRTAGKGGNADQGGKSGDSTDEASDTDSSSGSTTIPSVGTTQLTWDGKSFLGSSRMAIIATE